MRARIRIAIGTMPNIVPSAKDIGTRPYSPAMKAHSGARDDERENAGDDDEVIGSDRYAQRDRGQRRIAERQDVWRS